MKKNHNLSKTICYQKAFTLVELLVCLIVSAIVVLTIGVISSTSLRSHQTVLREGAVYNDIAYGLKSFQNRIRGSEGITTTAPAGLVDPVVPLAGFGEVTCTWANTPGTYDRLFITYKVGAINKQGAIGTCTVGDTQSLVYMPNISSTTELAEVIFSTVASDFEYFKFSEISGTRVTIDIKGAKNNIPFQMDNNVIWRRTP